MDETNLCAGSAQEEGWPCPTLTANGPSGTSFSDGSSDSTVTATRSSREEWGGGP